MTRNLKSNYLSHLYAMMSARITSKQLMLCCFQPFLLEREREDEEQGRCVHASVLVLPVWGPAGSHWDREDRAGPLGATTTGRTR